MDSDSAASTIQIPGHLSMPTWPPLLQIWRTVGHDQHGRTDAAVPFLGLPNIRSFHCCIAWLRSTPRLWSAPILHADECNFCSGKRLVFFEAPQSFSFLPFLLGYHKFTFSSTDYSRFRSLPYGAVQASIFSSPTIVLLSAFFCWVITILLSHLQSVQISAIWSSSG